MTRRIAITLSATGLLLYLGIRMLSGFSGPLYEEDGLSIQEIRSGGTTYIVTKVDLDKIEIKFLRNDPNVDGAIHPVFRKESTNLFTLSGVGIMDSKTVYLVLSEEHVNFYSFADFFLTELGCKNALFLDGSISQFYWDSSLEPETRKYGSYIFVTKGKR